MSSNGMSVGERIQRQAGNQALDDADVCPIEPFDDNVVCKRLEPKTRTVAGIHLPVNPVLEAAGRAQETEAQKAVRNLGVVLAVGPGRSVEMENSITPEERIYERIPIQNIAVGDTVILGRGIDVQPHGIDGPTYIMCPATAIIGKVVRQA